MMLDGPQRDWSYFESRKQDSDRAWIRGLTTSERFGLYSSFFDAVWTARQALPGDWERLERRRWEEKLAIRHRMVDAFTKLDKLRRERSAAHDSR
jgi:hypothetical protein